MSRPAEQADLILHGGSIVTIDAAGRVASAVAVRDGRIVAVGTDREVRAVAGHAHDTIDLRGRTLLPGFGDAHVHLGKGGLDRLRIDLSPVANLEGYGDVIRAYASSHPGDGWLTGGGWAMGAFPRGTPTAAMLDAIVADRPVFFNNRDNHGGWVNSAGLRAAGITAATPDPPDGRIDRDESGQPTGCLHEGAMRLVADLLPTPTEEDVIAGLLEGQRYLHSLGITQWQDAIVGSYEPMPETFEAYVRIATDGRLTGRVVAALWLPRGADDDDLALIRDRRTRGSVGRLRATSVKIMADGVAENFTAAVTEPYLNADGQATANRGISFFSREELVRLVPLLDGEGFDVHVHVIGDRAVRDTLDAIEAARATNGWRDTRPHLAHLQVVDPVERPRLRALGVTANFQPLWAAHDPQLDELTIPFLGPERAAWVYPIGSIAATGATIAFGSDWPVSSPDPLWAIHVAVNRTMPPGYPYGATAEPFLPDERITLRAAIRAYTMGTAYVNHLDQDTGSIEAGKAVDLVVLDRDLLAEPTDEIADARVLMTLVDGRVVHEGPGI
jgi:predicted amidohydrolase YtcJ